MCLKRLIVKVGDPQHKLLTSQSKCRKVLEVISSLILLLSITTKQNTLYGSASMSSTHFSLHIRHFYSKHLLFEISKKRPKLYFLLFIGIFFLFNIFILSISYPSRKTFESSILKRSYKKAFSYRKYIGDNFFTELSQLM